MAPRWEKVRNGGKHLNAKCGMRNAEWGMMDGWMVSEGRLNAEWGCGMRN